MKPSQTRADETLSVGDYVSFFFGLPFMFVGAFVRWAYMSTWIGWKYVQEFHI